MGGLQHRKMSFQVMVVRPSLDRSCKVFGLPCCCSPSGSEGLGPWRALRPRKDLTSKSRSSKPRPPRQKYHHTGKEAHPHVVVKSVSVSGRWLFVAWFYNNHTAKCFQTFSGLFERWSTGQILLFLTARSPRRYIFRCKGLYSEVSILAMRKEKVKYLIQFCIFTISRLGTRNTSSFHLWNSHVEEERAVFGVCFVICKN